MFILQLSCATSQSLHGHCMQLLSCLTQFLVVVQSVANLFENGNTLEIGQTPYRIVTTQTSEP